MPTNKWWGLALVLLLASPSTSGAKEFNPENPLNPPPPIYWCPDRTPDQQIFVRPQPGCTPLVEKEDEMKKATRKEKQTEPREPIKIVEIQNEASKFVQRYRQFLDCCAADVGSLKDIEEMEDEASHILKSVQQKGIFNSAGQPSSSGSGGTLGTFSRQWTISEIIGTVARAREDLRKLKIRLEQLSESMYKVDSLSYEAAARERRRIEEEEQAIAKEFRAKRPPDSARTGMEIQDTTIPTRIGGDIEDTTLKNSFGADVGYTVSPYSAVEESLKPRRGPEIEDTNTPTRYGPATQDTNLPYSFGFEINKQENPGGASTTPSRVGPAVGDSSLNKR